jgi:hypothetical protein
MTRAELTEALTVERFTPAPEVAPEAFLDDELSCARRRRVLLAAADDGRVHDQAAGA